MDALLLMAPEIPGPKDGDAFFAIAPDYVPPDPMANAVLILVDSPIPYEPIPNMSGAALMQFTMLQPETDSVQPDPSFHAVHNMPFRLKRDRFDYFGERAIASVSPFLFVQAIAVSRQTNG